MKTEHTPGPWRINKIYQSGIDIDCPRLLIGTDSPASLTVAEAFWDIPTAESNATLIASAPALLSENARLRQQVETLQCANLKLRGVDQHAEVARLREALQRLLDCPDLQFDAEEEETTEAKQRARIALGQLNPDRSIPARAALQGGGL
jgi:hypothetical protein